MPEGVLRSFERWLRTLSVLVRYKGSQFWRACGVGICGGEGVGMGRGRAEVGEVSAGGIPLISDMVSCSYL